MIAYADTAFICSATATDAHSPRAAARMATQALPLPWTWLHEIEFRNAVRLQIFQGRLDAAMRDKLLRAHASDLAQGVYVRMAPEHADTAKEAESLSAQYSEQLGTRSLDILHVAQALVLGTGDFLTFDKRQAALAEAAGLRVPEL